MSSRSYWREREAEVLQQRIADEEEYDKKIVEIYRDMLDATQKEIEAFYGKYADKEGITIADAKKRVSKVDIEAYERKAQRYVEAADRDRKTKGETDPDAEYFSETADEEMRLYNLTMKVNRLELLKANIGLELVKGHVELESYMGEILQGRTMDELERQAGILGQTIKSNAKKVHAIVNASFHNATYSDRIWMYQDLLKNDLAKLLQSGLIQGKNPRELARELKKKFDVKASDAERLMRTELARVQTEAQKQSFERNGFEQYEFITNGGCCPICDALDGKHFKVEDMMPGKNAPPMHPNCRCSIAAYEDSEEYEAWLDFLDKGGTTEEWNRMKSIEKTAKGDIIKADVESGNAKHREIKRQNIIEKGISQKRPIFASDLFGKLASNVPRKEGYYDVALHGASKFASFFGERINAETLADILKARTDYDGETSIRLLSCSTGKGERSFAQILANKLEVPVMAPDDIIWVKSDGTYTIGPTKYENTGNMITFYPEGK